jgi:hypothetical protein
LQTSPKTEWRSPLRPTFPSTHVADVSYTGPRPAPSLHVRPSTAWLFFSPFSALSHVGPKLSVETKKFRAQIGRIFDQSSGALRVGRLPQETRAALPCPCARRSRSRRGEHLKKTTQLAASPFVLSGSFEDPWFPAQYSTGIPRHNPRCRRRAQHRRMSGRLRLSFAVSIRPLTVVCVLPHKSHAYRRSERGARRRSADRLATQSSTCSDGSSAERVTCHWPTGCEGRRTAVPIQQES